MKKITALLIALMLTTVCLNAAFAIEKGDYHWRDYTVEVSQVEKNPMFVPANMGADEYAITVYITIDEVLWKDDAIWDAMYADARLADTQGGSYAPQAGGMGTDKPFFSFSFCIPKTVDADALTFSLEASGGIDDAAQSGPVEITTAAGDTLILTPLENGAFLKQSEKVTVHTRLGTTVHNSGSQFTAGSGLSLSTMKNTKQFDMPMVAFAYETKLDFDKAADAIGRIGAKATLTMDGTEYPPKVVWITEDMASFIFDCPEQPSGTPRFTVNDGRLVIEP